MAASLAFVHPDLSGDALPELGDGVHPNEQGSGKAARALVAALQKIGLP